MHAPDFQAKMPSMLAVALLTFAALLPSTGGYLYYYDAEKKLDDRCATVATNGPLTIEDINRWRLWPGLFSDADMKSGETLSGFKEAMAVLWKHQHPEDCTQAKYLISEGWPQGFGSEVHVVGNGLAFAMNMGRVYVMNPEGPISDKQLGLNNSFQTDTKFCIERGKVINFPLGDAPVGDVAAHAYACCIAGVTGVLLREVDVVQHLGDLGRAHHQRLARQQVHVHLRHRHQGTCLSASGPSLPRCQPFSPRSIASGAQEKKLYESSERVILLKVSRPPCLRAVPPLSFNPLPSPPPSTGVPCISPYTLSLPHHLTCTCTHHLLRQHRADVREEVPTALKVPPPAPRRCPCVAVYLTSSSRPRTHLPTYTHGSRYSRARRYPPAPPPPAPPRQPTAHCPSPPPHLLALHGVAGRQARELGGGVVARRLRRLPAQAQPRRPGAEPCCFALPTQAALLPPPRPLTLPAPSLSPPLLRPFKALMDKYRKTHAFKVRAPTYHTALSYCPHARPVVVVLPVGVGVGVGSRRRSSA